MSEKRKIKLYINTGFAGSRHSAEQDLPDGWDEWTEKEQEEYLDEAAQEYLNNRIDYGAYVE